MSALTRIANYNREFASRCNVARWFGALFHVGVQEHLIADAKEEQATILSDAYSAEQCDREALKLLREAAADGFSNADLPAVVKVCRLIERSAEKDRRITEAIAS